MPTPAFVSTVVSSLISVATAQIGVREDPPGSNWGSKVSDFIRAGGYSEPVPWCLCFARWCADQACTHAGTRCPLPVTGDCDTLLFAARREHYLYKTANPGDIFLLMATDTDAVHAGIVVATEESGTIVTIEGNTNTTGAREGQEVLKRRRTMLRLSFVRWTDLLQPPPISNDPSHWDIVYNFTKITEGEVIGDQTFVPARAVLEGIYGTVKVTRLLRYNVGDNLLYWNASPVPAQVQMLGNVAYVPVRKLVGFLGLTADRSPDLHRITVS